MKLRGVSLRAQLLTAFVTLVVLTTAALTYDAYRTSIAKLETEARTNAAAAANARAQALERMLANRQRRAEGMLDGARELCAEVKPTGEYALAPDCVKPMLNAFRAAERATGAIITTRDEVVASSGTAVQTMVPPEGALARVTWVSARPAYVMYATLGAFDMYVQFGSSEVAAVFRDASSLGDRGEAFLMDAGGQFLTAPKYVVPGRGVIRTPGARLEASLACGAEAGERLDVDYRGIRTLHAYHPVPALEGACVDAHVNWDEALQPAADLRDRLLMRSLLFILVGALVSLLASHRIAAPVQRLARAARGLRTRLDEPIPVGGPSEVQSLGAALRESSTELAALVGREQAARLEAQSANRAKDRFLAAVSHELRTPLTAILGWTHIMRTQGPPLVPKLERGLEAIERNAESQRRLVEDLLDVSRIVAGRFRIQREIVDLALVVDRALDTIRPQAEEKGVGVYTRIEHAALTVAGDPLRLEQVVSNLASNAVKFSRTGGSVLVSVTRVDDTVQLAVRDDGQGIDPESLPHIFDWFWQGEPDPGSASSGLGLGLGIVRQLVEIHGGTVRAESDGHGFGSRFVVTLPLAAAPGLPARPQAPPPGPEPRVTPVRSSFDIH